MKNWVFLTIVFLVGCNKPPHEASNKVGRDFVFPFDKKAFDWAKVEAKVDEKVKIKFGEARPWMTMMNHDAYLSDLHPMDVNNDGHMDMIYSGIGPVAFYTIVSLGNESDDFAIDGYVVDLRFQDKRLSKIYVERMVSSGAPPIDGQNIIDVSYEGNRPIFTPTFKNETMAWFQFPKQKSPYEIEIISDTVIGRSAPLELDTPYQYVLEIEGNRLGLLTRGTKAQIIGDQIDSLKNVWLCAVIYPEYRILGYPYPYNIKTDSNDGTTRMLWIPNKGIKRTSGL